MSMAYGRMIVATVAIDKRLNSLSIEGQLVFLMTLPHLDRDGLVVGDAPLLAAKAIPRRPELHPRLDDIIQEWIETGLVLPYETDDCRVLFFPGFSKNQKLRYDREAASQFAPPPGYRRTNNGLEPDQLQNDSGPTPDLLRSDSGVIQDQIPLKLNNKKGIEANSGVGPAAAAGVSDDGFALACRAFQDNISFLSPMIAEKIEDDLKEYPASWFVDAVQEAVTHNGRSLPYVESILKRWKKEGKGNQRNGNGNGYARDERERDPYKGARELK